MNFKRIFIKTSLFLSLLFILTACHSVMSIQQVGSEPVKLKRADWDGVWTHPEGALHVHVVSRSQGILRLAWIEEGGKKNFSMQIVKAFVRKVGTWKMVSVREEDAKKGANYLWARIENDGDHILIWLPDADRIKSLIEKGHLEGKVEEKSIVLGKLSNAQLARLSSTTEIPLFLWDKPLILIHSTE
ncbi:MAG: hypothetical protein Q9M28_06555 [Mariprofundaceae bacterium]|nr:hypothetical protein [Mariprofundaceae bacterium]